VTTINSVKYVKRKENETKIQQNHKNMYRNITQTINRGKRAH